MIVFFSGTGNSAYVAGYLAQALGDTEVVNLRGKALRPPLSLHPSCDRIVWVFPIYSWGVPPVVANYIKDVDITKDGITHHMVATYGDDIGYADRQWNRLIESRGWHTGVKRSVEMPNTYTAMKGFDVDPKAVESRKLSAAPARIDDIARAILSGATDTDVHRGNWPGIKSGLIRRWFERYAMSAKPFHPSDACIGCGICSRECPTENIAMSDRRPQWGNNCAMCLRCYHVCPRHAVEYGKKTRKKGQYLCPLAIEFNKTKQE